MYLELAEENFINLSKQKFKHISLVIFLIICPLLIGCEQPPSGELEPIAVDGATLTTSRFENDTLLFSENGLNVKFYGSWEGSIGLRIAIKNKSVNDLIIRFDQMIVKNEREEFATFGDITDDTREKFTYIRHSRIGNVENKEELPKVEVAARSQRRFEVVFSNIFSYKKDNPSDTIHITLPIEIENDLKTVREFKIAFKKIERKTGDITDPEAW